MGKTDLIGLLNPVPGMVFQDTRSTLLGADRPIVCDKDRVHYGVDYLDKALGGIRNSELVMITAESGAGKTQFVTNIALTNTRQGKRVHFIALEAYRGEIQDRIEFNKLAEKYYAFENRPYMQQGLSLRFSDFVDGKYNKLFSHLHEGTEDGMGLENLFTYYRNDEFTIDSMKLVVTGIKDRTDLVIIDHVHYFDYDEEQANKALKFIAKEARDLALIHNIPIILVAHIRKQDLKNRPLAPHREDIHGSGDLSKIATTVITLGRGDIVERGRYITYFRIAKSRIDGGLDRYAAMVVFDSRKLEYSGDFKIGLLTGYGQKFELLAGDMIPNWAK